MRALSRFVSVLLGVLSCGLAVLAPHPVSAQGRTDYFNVESPQVHPIEVFTIAGHDYLAILNTPDNSVELYDTNEDAAGRPRFLEREALGLEPVSVRWVEERQSLYVANFLGDSISVVAIEAPMGPTSFSAELTLTVPVTDEPMDLVYVELDGPMGPQPVLHVAHATHDAIGSYDALDLSPITPGAERRAAVLPSGLDLNGDTLSDDMALKQPWTLATACDRLFVLGHLGGNVPTRYDFDVYSEGLDGSDARALAGLGSTNWNMAFGDDDTLYLVGAEARNGELFGEEEARNATSGFVESILYVVEDACSASPTVHRRDVNLHQLTEPPGPVLNSSLLTENPVNGHGPIERSSRRRSGFAGSGGFGSRGGGGLPLTMPVAKAGALAQLTDLAVLERPGELPKVFVAAFSSDRIGVFEPDLNVTPLQWPRGLIDLSPGASSTRKGPRGLALRDRPGQERLYVLNRFTNSVTVIDPLAETVAASFDLRSHPVPPWILAGREFLYDARLSGSGFVSCSSCHLDGRTDGLAWDLSDGVGAPLPPEIDNISLDDWPANKEFMVTQSLQGLLNWEVPPESMPLFTNGRYHWRADRDDFTAFNPAFANLMGGAELSTADMKAYEEFINSIHYPPNPRQPVERVFSGDVGDPDDAPETPFLTEELSGSGARKGLKLFFTAVSDGQGSCQSCHALPEGSNNVITVATDQQQPHPIPDDATLSAVAQPMESAAMRGLFQKESRLSTDGASLPFGTPVTGYEGLSHTGLFPSGAGNVMATINGFNFLGFDLLYCSQVPGPGTFCDNLIAVNQYCHEFDFGTAPIVGRNVTVDSDNRTDTTVLDALDLAESQARVANAGLAVRGHVAGFARDYWFDPHADLYRPSDPAANSLPRVVLLATLVTADDRLVFTSTPLGTERRFAHPDGAPTPLTGPAPSEIQLLPMVPNTAHVDIPSFSKLWVPPPTVGVGQFGFFSHTVRVYQNALLDDGPPDGFGLCDLRHEAPRRFRVSGDDIRPGAELHLHVATLRSEGPPDTSQPFDDEKSQPTLTRLVLPLYATEDSDANGRAVWETAVEMEPLLFYGLMAGRPVAPSLPSTVLPELTSLDWSVTIDPESQPGLFDPIAWNHQWVQVVNEDGTLGDGGWQSLTIEPGPDCP
ncbi:MAG: hypothetical protein AAF533_28025 [Acidobacteriota bacterium]